MRTLKSIIEETDTLVPNPFDAERKIGWLNAINKEFFEFVKIPTVHVFFTEVGRAVYPIPADIKARNVDQLKVGGAFYVGEQYEDVNPGHNQWFLDEVAGILQLIPPPYVNGMRSTIRYAKMWSTTFLANNLTVSPDAPEEYQDLYVAGLCERVAKAMNDVTLANHYSVDYRGQLLSAQQTYGMTPTGGVTE